MKNLKKVLALAMALCTVLSVVMISGTESFAAQSVSSVFISEVCFNPAYETEDARVTSYNDFLEFIEIKNVGSTAVDLSKMTVNYSTKGLNSDSWFVNSLVFESSNDKIMDPGETWIIGIYNILTPRLDIGYSGDEELKQFWKVFNSFYSCSTKAARRAVCATAKNREETWLSGCSSLSNTGSVGAVKLVSGKETLAQVEYSPDKYGRDGYSLNFILKDSTARIFGTAGCSPLTLYDYQFPNSDSREAPKGEDVDLVSMNVCYEIGKTPATGATADYSVDKRIGRVLDILDSSAPDVICLQEITAAWWSGIMAGLSDYGWVGESCYGTVNGEASSKTDSYNLVFYDKDKYDLADSGNTWLLESTPSKGNKVCTWALLRDKSTSTAFVVFNTHLSTDDSSGGFANRAKELNNLQSCIKKVLSGISDKYGANKNDIPVILCGDFNIDEGSPLYNKITDDIGFADSKYMARKTENCATFNYWGNWADYNGTIIDYCFVSNGADVDRYSVNTASGEDGYLASDHYALEVELTVPSNSFAQSTSETNIFQKIISAIIAFLQSIIDAINSIIASLG